MKRSENDPLQNLQITSNVMTKSKLTRTKYYNAAEEMYTDKKGTCSWKPTISSQQVESDMDWNDIGLFGGLEVGLDRRDCKIE